MTHVHFEVDDSLMAQIDERLDAGGFTSRAEYFRYLARNDLQRGMVNDGA